jgi:hypothetical protein
LPCLFQDMGSSWKLSEDNLPHAFVWQDGAIRRVGSPELGHLGCSVGVTFLEF